MFHLIKNVCLRTNCTTSEECWKESLAYRSSELIEQLFSFSSLSVYVARYQQLHPNEVCVEFLLAFFLNINIYIS
jgi:hypothetical protein